MTTPSHRHSDSKRNPFQTLLALTGMALLASLTDAVAERFLNWFLSQDWAAVMDSFISQTSNLPWETIL